LVEVLCDTRAKYGAREKRHDVATELTFLRLQEGNALEIRRRSMKAGDAIGDNPRDLRGVSSPFDGKIQLRCSSNFPTTLGRTSARQL